LALKTRSGHIENGTFWSTTFFAHFFRFLYSFSFFLFFLILILILALLSTPGEPRVFAQVRENIIFLKIKSAQFSSLIF